MSPLIDQLNKQLDRIIAVSKTPTAAFVLPGLVGQMTSTIAALLRDHEARIAELQRAVVLPL